MEYRREMMMLRAPGGQRAGFLIWERGEREASLRCNLDGLQPGEELRFCWMPAGDFALLDGGMILADAAGAVRHTLRIAVDATPVAVALARKDGSLYAYAYARGLWAEGADAPERLLALLPQPNHERRKSSEPADPPPSEPEPEPKPEPAPESQAQPWAEAPWPAVPWPPPPGLPGAVWRGGRWVLE